MSAPRSTRGDLHAELDRLDRELEVLRERLADEQGALREARARCRELSRNLALIEEPAPARAGAPDPETNAAGPPRRLARTSRLDSTLAGSRPLRAATLRAIPGGLASSPAPVARLPRAVVRSVDPDEVGHHEDHGGPDAA